MVNGLKLLLTKINISNRIIIDREIIMTLIEQIYEELKENKITKNNEDFSIRFLNRSPKYYSVIKHKNLEANNEILVNLANKLEQLNFIRSKYSNNNKCEHIEKQIANELASRTITKQKPSKLLLNKVIRALQEHQTYLHTTN